MPWCRETEALLLYVQVYGNDLSRGVLPIDFEHAVGALYYFDSATMQDFAFAAYVMGQMNVEEAGDGTGDPVAGTIEGDLIAWGI